MRVDIGPGQEETTVRALGRTGVRSLALVAVLLGLVFASACAWTNGDGAHTSASPSPSAISIASGHLSGERSETLDLGEHQLGDRVWLAWALTGPEDAVAKFVLNLRGSDVDLDASTTRGPSSFATLRPTDERALGIRPIAPGRYRVSFRQKVGYGGAPEFAVDFEVFTSR